MVLIEFIMNYTAQYCNEWKLLAVDSITENIDPTFYFGLKIFG